MDFYSINFLFLVPLAVIGLICAYTDIKYGKIFNKWIVFGLIYVFFLYVFLFSYKTSIDYIFELILNGAIAFLVGYLLWHFKLWSAGDAKLFAVYAFLIPLHFYSKSYTPYFPSFNLLVNVFIPILLVLVVSALIVALKEAWRLRGEIKQLKLLKIKKVSRSLTPLLPMFLNYLFVFTMLKLFHSLTAKSSAGEILSNPFFIFVLLFLIMGYLNKKRQEKKWIGLIIYGVALGYAGLLVFFGEFQKLISILSFALIFMTVISFARQALDYYIQKKQIQKIKIKNIQEGMILVKNEASFLFKKLKEKEEELGFLDAGGLKKNQAELIRSLFQENEKAEADICKTFPFAPFLFLSAVISILTQSSFLPLIKRFFQYLS